MDIFDQCNTVGVDQFGRKVESVGGFDKEKQVGIFYFPWVGQGYADDIYDATKIMEQYGQDVLFYQDVPKVSPAGHFHYWGEPLFGYYNNADPYILRKHMEMLTAAGVDYLTCDATNTYTYYNVYIKLAEVIHEMIQEGLNPPKISFYTHTHSIKTVTKLYEEFYSKNLYPDTWYRVNGKPFVVAFTDPAQDKEAEKITIGHYTDYDPKPYPEEIAEFFHFVRPQWPFNEIRQDAMPWIEWVFPQPLHGEFINVAVCSHPAVPLSASYTRGWLNYGRGYDPYKNENIAEDVNKGTYIQHQWEVALKSGAKKVFVTGWNEWVAIKTPWEGEYMLCDAASLEYSRDIEPMKGGYEDAFYLQMIQNIRRFKGAGKAKAHKPMSVDIFDKTASWEGAAVFRKLGKDKGRDFVGGAATVHYKQAPPRNAITQARMAHDSENIYIRVECEQRLKGVHEPDFMNIYLGVGEPEAKGWESYEFLVIPLHDGVSNIYALGKEHNTEYIGTARHLINENAISIRLPRSIINAQNAKKIYFKVADNTNCQEDIMNTYTQGSALPMGRLSCEYIME